MPAEEAGVGAVDSLVLGALQDERHPALASLLFGDYRLAALDLETNDIRELPSIDGAKDIDPQ